MSNIWDQFDESIDLEDMQKEIKELEENGQGEFEEVPFGKYEVRVEKMELGTSKANKPMAIIWFKIIDGDFKNSLIFKYQVLEKPIAINIFNGFLKSLDSGLEIKFESYGQYAKLLDDIKEAIADNLEYALEYGENKNGFTTHEVKEVFEV